MQPGWDFDNNDNNASNDTEPHGTACAGIIAAAVNDQGVVGIAPNCHIVTLRAAGRHTWVTWAATFDWAAQHGQIISCSWHITPNNTLSAAIRRAVVVLRTATTIAVDFNYDRPDRLYLNHLMAAHQFLLSIVKFTSHSGIPQPILARHIRFAPLPTFSDMACITASFLTCPLFLAICFAASRNWETKRGKLERLHDNFVLIH